MIDRDAEEAMLVQNFKASLMYASEHAPWEAPASAE